MGLARDGEVEVDDSAVLGVWTAGPASNSTVMFVHGFSLDHSTWDAVADRVAAAGHNVVAVDLRGHGASTLGDAEPSPERLIDDLSEAAKELGLLRVHLVGHSLGAVVVLAARARRDLGFELLSVTAVAGTERAFQNRLMRVGAWAFGSRLGVRLLRSRGLGRVMMSSWFGDSPSVEQLDRIRSLVASCPRPTRAVMPRAVSDLDIGATLSSAGPPALLVCGEKDRAAPPAVSRSLAGAIPDAEVCVVAGAGHMVMVERPVEVGDALCSFIERCERS